MYGHFINPVRDLKIYGDLRILAMDGSKMRLKSDFIRYHT